MRNSLFPLFLLGCILLAAAVCDNVKTEQFSAVPSWAKRAVWYQIFPERFANGDRNNDPELRDIEGGWPHFTPDEWFIHPWNSDWYALQPWEESYERDFYWCAGLRRYGGDLQGVMDRLDYLQDLGVTALYFNPLFESPSLHKYDATMYHHIDNNFGPNPQMDREIWSMENPADPSTWQWSTADRLFLRLIEECHNRGMKVIIDGVFNHVGSTFWAFRDVAAHQENSAYKEWFIITRWDDPATPENEFEYEGWAGVKDLPEIKENERGLVEGPRQHVRDIVLRWMDPDGDGDPSDGIDGWRLDVSEKVNINFWKDFRVWVKRINPDAYITGELWWDDWSQNKMFNAAPWLRGETFDAVMNYRVAQAIKKLCIDVEGQISVDAFIETLTKLFKEYPRENLLVCQNLMGSHDVDRLASQIVNPDRWYDHAANPGQNENYEVRKPNEIETAKLRLITGIQMTLPGAPMIYYGDEAGMWGGDDPDCRKPMVWPEIEYDAEISHPMGKSRPEDDVSFDGDLFTWYKQLISIRKRHPALNFGDIEFFPAEENILVYTRSYEGQHIAIICNNSRQDREVVLDSSRLNLNRGRTSDLIGGGTIDVVDDQITMNMNPFQIFIFTAN